MREWQRWVPAGILACGCVLLASVGVQKAVPLRQPLKTLPTAFGAFQSHGDIVLDKEQERVAGMSTYVLRNFAGADSTDPGFSVYVGYYENQTQGRTIHSPKNCLPGAGWEALQSGEEPVRLADGRDVRVNRYLLSNRGSRALVLYWYQGRGRVAANEYQVKLDLLRDAALRGRSDEALVRIVVPVTPGRNQDEALNLAKDVARTLVPAVYDALPS